MASGKSMVVPSNETPTFWNRDAIVGFVIGSVAGNIIGGAIGMVAGGLIGKNRMEKEQIAGKVVSEPSFWNKSIFSGLLVGDLISMAAFFALPLAFGAPFIVSNILPISAALLGITAIGAIMGGLSGKERLTKEYADAKAYVAEHGNYTPGQHKAPQISRSTSVSPEEAQALYEKLSPKQKSFVDAEMVRDDKQLVAAR